MHRPSDSMDWCSARVRRPGETQGSRRSDVRRACSARSQPIADTTYRQASCRAFGPEARRVCSRTLRLCRWRTAGCGDRRRPAACSGRRARGRDRGPRLAHATNAARRRCRLMQTPAKGGRRFATWSLVSASSCSAFLAEAGVLRLGESIGLRLALLRPHPSEGVVGASSQIDIDVVDIAHDIRIGAECWHDVLLRGAHILAATRHDAEEIAVTEPLERVLQRRRVTRSFAIGTVADVALRVVTAVARVHVPIHGAVCLNLVSWISVLIEIFAVNGLDRGRIARTVGVNRRAANHRQYEGNRKKAASHERFPCGFAAPTLLPQMRRAATTRVASTE